jgi:hypothetical protein
MLETNTRKPTLQNMSYDYDSNFDDPVEVQSDRIYTELFAEKERILTLLDKYQKWPLPTEINKYELGGIIANQSPYDIYGYIATITMPGEVVSYITLQLKHNVNLHFISELDPQRYFLVMVQAMSSDVYFCFRDVKSNVYVAFKCALRETSNDEKSKHEYVIVSMQVYLHKNFNTNESVARELMAMVDKYYVKFTKERKIKIGLIVQDQNGFDVNIFNIPKPSVPIESNYGQDFANQHYGHIIHKLKHNPRGVYIFESEPGCGKTYFIKHLIGEVDNRTFLYLSDSVISAGFDSPALIRTLTNYPNCVVIIEDGEKYMADRGQDSNSLVSGLLNVADGILGDILGFSLIITHNQKAASIDTALLRKGRIQYQYKFGKLTKVDAQRKLDELKKNFVATEPMTLADIYNVEDVIGDIKKTERPRIGFGCHKE